jgi:hypothetical protein
MKANLNDFGTGWFALELGITSEEIDQLISSLQLLQAKKFDHFVLANNSVDDTKGVENIEVYLSAEDDKDNMVILGGDISPTR